MDSKKRPDIQIMKARYIISAAIVFIAFTLIMLASGGVFFGEVLSTPRPAQESGYLLLLGTGLIGVAAGLRRGASRKRISRDEAA